MYDEGEDTTKAVYVSKIEEIRGIAGPIIQRYNDKIEEERQAAQKAQEEAEAAKRAEEDAKKEQEEPKTNDVEMKDSEPVQPSEVEEPGNNGK